MDWDEDFLSGFDICVASVQTENPIPKRMNLQAPPAAPVPDHRRVVIAQMHQFRVQAGHRHR